MDSDKLFKNKIKFSSWPLDKEFLLKLRTENTISTTTLQVIVGELLGDGHINHDPINNPQINGRLEFTFSAKILHYVNYLKYDVLSSVCTNSSPTPWPNKEITGKDVTQFWFSSKRLPYFTLLHSFWYKQINNVSIKVLPSNIEQILSPIGLAHWIMGDGYYYKGNVILCTDNFSEKEVLKLIEVLEIKFFLKASIRKRTNKNNVVWRISISKTSLADLKNLVLPYIITEMQYKLGITS